MHPSFVRSEETFREILARLSGQTSLYIDCEFQTEGHYFPKLCLVQLGFGNELWAVDPRRVDLRTLAPHLESQELQKVVHDGRQDLPILARATGAAHISSVFDTQIAAAFSGHGGSVGYANLVLEICGKKLDKSLQMSDWSRELTDAQLEYALDDIRYLPAVSQSLTDKLTAQRRLEWVREACSAAATTALTRPDPAKLYRRVGSTTRLTTDQLGILREVAQWRDRVAQSIDKPAPSVASDTALKSIAMHPPRDLKSVETVRGLGAGRNHPWGKQLLEAIAVGLARPEPKFRPMLSPEVEAKIDGALTLLRLARHHVAVNEGIAGDMLADQSCLRDLAESQVKGTTPDPNTEPLTGWRREVIGELLMRVLRGEVTFRVDTLAAAGVRQLD